MLWLEENVRGGGLEGVRRQVGRRRAVRVKSDEGLPGRVWQRHLPLWIPDVMGYADTYVKCDGAWFYAERLLCVDWIEQRALS